MTAFALDKAPVEDISNTADIALKEQDLSNKIFIEQQKIAYDKSKHSKDHEHKLKELELEREKLAVKKQEINVKKQDTLIKAKAEKDKMKVDERIADKKNATAIKVVKARPKPTIKKSK